MIFNFFFLSKFLLCDMIEKKNIFPSIILYAVE